MEINLTQLWWRITSSVVEAYRQVVRLIKKSEPILDEPTLSEPDKNVGAQIDRAHSRLSNFNQSRSQLPAQDNNSKVNLEPVVDSQNPAKTQRVTYSRLANSSNHELELVNEKIGSNMSTNSKKISHQLARSLKKLLSFGKAKTASRRRRSRRRKSRFTEGQRQLQRMKRLRLIAIGLFTMVILGITGFFGAFAYFSRDLPQPGQVVRRDGYSTKIYDRDEQLLYDLFDEEKRIPVNMEDVPEIFKQATVAIEDKDFYKHQGYDLLTILRIPYNVVFKHRVVGGSTLTQQLVKNALLSNDRTISRKFKEIVLSIQIERTFSKDEILAMYLDEAPYGGTAWGVMAATELYFNKPIQELTLLESAFLAGLPQRPSIYSPYSGKADKDGTPYWQVRTSSVLQGMLNQGYIDTEAYNQAIEELPSLTFSQGNLSIQAPHFVFYVKEQLVEMFGEELVEQGGLKVKTTLDMELQDQAQQIVTEEIDSLEDYKITNGASLAMDPQTGEILAMIGSQDYFNTENGGQFNVVTDGLRQPGSSIKPVTYLGLLRQGYTPASMLIDTSTDFRSNENAKAYIPRNYAGGFAGPVSLRNALGSSLNIPAVKALALQGIENFLTLAYDMGFVTLQPTTANMQRFGLAVTLGGAEVHLIDMVTAYSAFANGGLKVEPVSILSVEDSDGNLVYQHRPVGGRRVMSDGEAFLINDILSDNNARLMTFGVNSLLNTGRPIAVKTGTTNDMIDNWTVGWSQNIIIGVWVGNNDNTSMSQVASGVTGASPIWRSTIMAALKMGYEAPAWEKPSEIEQVQVDSISGYQAHDEFPERTDYVIRGTLLSPPDTIHYKAKVCKGESNKLATEARIAGGDYDEREVIDLRREDPLSIDGTNRWMIGIQAWIDAQDDPRYRVPTEYCGDVDDVSVKLEKPRDKDEFDGDEIEVKIKAGSNHGIKKIELYVDGDKRVTAEDDEYKGKLKLNDGQHELYAKAYSRDGKEVKGDVIRIGTGGAPWEKPAPTPTPTPTIIPTLIPTDVPVSPMVTP